MTLKDLSSEQQDLVRLALDGKNVLCDACIGSGKTSTINVLCNEFDSSKEILYLTYNRLLKLDAQEKILNDNVTVQNYHGFASKILYRRGIKNVGQGEQIGMVLRKRVPVGHFDVLIIDEYQDINEEISKMLEYIKESNPGLQIIAVGDMKQKIYDQTSLDIWSFIHKFLGKHTQVNFTQCFRLSHDLAQRLGNIWGKDINGVNKNCKVSTMSREQVVDYLDTKNPKDVLCLGARTGSMVKVLNELEARPGNLYDKNHVYASIKEPDGEKHVAPGADVGIFTTFDGSKGMERPICVVFDFTESYWCSRVFQPMARYEILRNLFCVAASRGKDEVIFVEPPKKEDRFGLVSDKTLMTPVKMNQEFNTKFDISEMFDFKFDEDVEHCYQLINTTPVFHKDVHEIEIKHSDAMIDLAPCIGIYQQANFFDYYDIDSAIAFYMYLHNDKKVALPSSWKSVEEKVLFLTMLMTSQDRYVKQVELPFITRAQETDLNKRLSMVFTPDESVQERCELTAVVDTKVKKKLVISGMADVVKDNKVYLLKFVSSLAHKHFLQCACYMLATGLKQGVVWNIRDNMMYEIEIPDPDKFLDAVITCITKQVFAKAESYTISKDYTQDLDTIIEQIMTDDSLPEFDVGGNVKEEKKTADEGMTWIFPSSQRSKRGIEMNNTMIPILPELKSAMKQVTKQYQSDFDLDTKVIQKAAKEAKADGKPQTFLWFCRESGTYIARESNAYLKESPMYISYQYYADQQRREAKGIKAYVVTVTGLDGRKPLGFATLIDYFKECERQKRYAVPANRIALHFEKETVVTERPKTIPRHHSEYGELKSVTYLPDDDAALDYALSMAHQSREKSNRKVGA